jgi:quinol monooxygenase YgiN
MIVVAGTFRVPADKIEALQPHAKAVIAATRQEAGCTTYSFAHDVMDGGLVRIFEIWETREHLDRHLKAPHMMPWRAALAELGASGRDIKIYRVEGKGEPV